MTLYELKEKIRELCDDGYSEFQAEVNLLPLRKIGNIKADLINREILIEGEDYDE